MAEIWGAITAVVIGTTVSVALAASAPGAPKTPNAAASGRKGIIADLKTLPGRRAVDRAAALGLNIDYPTGKLIPIYADTPEGQRAKFFGLTQYAIGFEQEKRNADFTGLGQIDVDTKVARGTAEGLLKVQQKYGVDFANEARKQQELADPEGTAARKRLFDEVNRIREGRKDVAHPVSDSLDAQVMADLDAGRGLGADQQGELDRVLRDRAAGGDAATADITQALSTNAEAEQRYQNRLQRSMGYLASGATPEDREFREDQTDLSNLSAALSGRTPQSQFASLAGAQQGTTPQARGAALPQANPNAAGIGQQGAQFNYQAGIQQTANTVNPWFAGLSTAVKGAQVAGAAGWKPLG